jgi:hypothetical protein
MSHHYSGPNFTFPGGDPRYDFADLFAFPQPEDASKSILIMDVHPSMAVDPAGPTTSEPFAQEALYEIRIDSNGDNIADITFQTRFRRSGETMTATVRRLEGTGATTADDAGHVVIHDAPISMGADARVIEEGNYRFFAGWRSDPFFFDEGALNHFQWVGHDVFGDTDICSIVLEVPNSALGALEVRIWARVLVQQDDGRWVQTDRGARASQTPFLTGDQNEAYRLAEPASDARFIPALAHSIEHLGGLTSDEAVRAASTLLPDFLRYDPTRPVRYPENGRKLTDDAADAFVTTVTNGKITGDGIGPHTDLLDSFPYLGPPHDSARRLESSETTTQAVPVG